MITARSALLLAMSRNVARSSSHIAPLIAFFFSGRFSVMLTMPSVRWTSMVSTAADDTDGMGFNPHRKYVPKKADYVFVTAAVLCVVALLAWALLA